MLATPCRSALSHLSPSPPCPSESCPEIPQAPRMSPERRQPSPLFHQQQALSVSRMPGTERTMLVFSQVGEAPGIPTVNVLVARASWHRYTKEQAAEGDDGCCLLPPLRACREQCQPCGRSKGHRARSTKGKASHFFASKEGSNRFKCCSLPRSHKSKETISFSGKARGDQRAWRRSGVRNGDDWLSSRYFSPREECQKLRNVSVPAEVSHEEGLHILLQFKPQN